MLAVENTGKAALGGEQNAWAMDVNTMTSSIAVARQGVDAEIECVNHASSVGLDRLAGSFGARIYAT